MNLPRRLQKTLLYFAIGLAIVYITDFAAFQLRQSRGTGLGTVPVEQYLQLSLKANKVEYDYVGTKDETCTRSLLPQSVASQWIAPCWWRERHRQRWIEAHAASPIPRAYAGINSSVVTLRFAVTRPFTYFAFAFVVYFEP